MTLSELANLRQIRRRPPLLAIFLRCLLAQLETFRNAAGHAVMDVLVAIRLRSAECAAVFK